LDKQILQEIVRVVQAEQRVPSTIEVDGNRYALTYLEDHERRMQDAIANRDANLLSMLFGQLASKVKYQLAASQPPQKPAKVAKARRHLQGARVKAVAAATTSGREAGKQARSQKGASRTKLAVKEAKATKPSAARRSVKKHK
jgi:hypothetical protein